MTTTGIFSKGAYTTSAPDNNRKILIQVSGGEGKPLFNNCFLTNFDNSRSADVMMIKDTDSGFGFTTFGQNPVQFTLAGIYMGDGTYADDDKSENSKYDPEAIFDLYNISSPTRLEITITTMYPKGDGYNAGDNKDKKYHKPIEYKGYMLRFLKNPMNDDKMAAYGFNITCVCRQTTSFNTNAEGLDKK